MIRKARLPVPLFRFGRFDAESVPGLVILGMNAVGLALAGTLVADEINNARELAAASVPDLEPPAEEQSHDATNATASSSHTYSYETSTTGPAHDTAPLPLNGDGLHGEVRS